MLRFLIRLLGLAAVLHSSAVAAQDGGYNVTADLWAKAVLKPASGDVTLIWQMVGAEITPSGVQVISGYFYADPAVFAYGSVYNPEVFVKIYIAKSGWCNIAFNHVTVDAVEVSSAKVSDAPPVDIMAPTTPTGLSFVDNNLGQGTYRLPTEAEWEYAARAGGTTAFANGGITVTDCRYDPNPDAMVLLQCIIQNASGRPETAQRLGPV